MSLSQIKLSAIEWQFVEKPVSDKEMQILKLIRDGYHNVDITHNHYKSVMGILKITFSDSLEMFLYNKYFKERVTDIERIILKKVPSYQKIQLPNIVRINSVDMARIENTVQLNEDNAYEFLLLSQIKKLVYYFVENQMNDCMYYYYTLTNLMNASILHLNRYIKGLGLYVTGMIEPHFDAVCTITNGVNIIELNKKILKYKNTVLYQHQKEVFMLCKQPKTKLILYAAPTGTGKTLTPIGLSEEFKIIYVCAARHIGLSLARSAISVNKKIAFAFGCDSVDDIRLHNLTAKEFTKHRKSGGIYKVDNMVGDNVQIMICDIKSYQIAMHYMLMFFKRENIIMYWDEPTISLDCETHEFHKMIQSNWKNNQIPNIVLASATLPQYTEITDVIQGFLSKTFQDGESDSEFDYANPIVENVVSFDCIKSIPIIDSNGFASTLHTMTDNYANVQEMANYCERNLTLLRYFEFQEIIDFVIYINSNLSLPGEMQLRRYFHSIETISMLNIKHYYTRLFSHISESVWGTVYSHFQTVRIPKIESNDSIDNKGNKIVKMKSLGGSVHDIAATTVTGNIGVAVTTKDAYTLTDGPTIYLCNDVNKVAKFCIQQANIPASVMKLIMEKIEFNNKINDKISELEQTLGHKQQLVDSAIGSSNGNKTNKSKESTKLNRESMKTEGSSDISRLTNEINILRNAIKIVMLNDAFVPNTQQHLLKWAENVKRGNSFTSSVTETHVNAIMALHNVNDCWKILLMMGIGVFVEGFNQEFLEIMKDMASQELLFMVIATSDYIYGTNNNFCHAYIGKDLDLTQEKIIQSLGRVGRNNIQQTYTVRFRDNEQIRKLFSYNADKPEIQNMNKLFG